MPRSFIRWVALLLIPCLLADSVPASGVIQSVAPPICLSPSIYLEQAVVGSLRWMIANIFKAGAAAVRRQVDRRIHVSPKQAEQERRPERLLVADDPSGANELAAAVVDVYGIPATVIENPADLSKVPPGHAVVLNVNTREGAARRAPEALRRAVEAAAQGELPPDIKIDSTLRGIDLALRGFIHAGRSELALVVPAYPAQGRVTQGSQHIVRGGVLEENLPTFLAEELDVSRQNVVMLSSQVIEQGPEAVRTALAGYGRGTVIVPEVTRDEHLDILAAALNGLDRPVLRAGSAGFLRALLRAHAGQREGAPPARFAPAAKPGAALAVIGSINEVATRQIEFAKRHLGKRLETIEVSLTSLNEAKPAVLRTLREGRPVLLRTPRTAQSLTSTEVGRLSSGIQQILSDSEVQALIRALFVSGGSTFELVKEAWQAWGHTVQGELTEGQPWGVLQGGTAPAIPIVTKAGGFGADETLLQFFMQSAPQTLGLTLGDPLGIGPEITAMLFLKHPDIYGGGQPLVIGNANVMEQALDSVRAKDPALDPEMKWQVKAYRDPADVVYHPDEIPVLDIPAPALESADLLRAEVRESAEVQTAAALLTKEILEKTIALAQSGDIAAILTNPVDKESLSRVLPGFQGHTEFLAERIGSETGKVLMVLGHAGLYVIHASRVHQSLANAVGEYVGEGASELLKQALEQAHRFATQDLGLERPRLVLATLDPAEDGSEDQAARQAIQAAVRGYPGLDVIGVMPAAAAFAAVLKGQADIVVVRYHDQGHVFTKLLSAIQDETQPGQALPPDWEPPRWNGQPHLRMGPVWIVLADSRPLSVVLQRMHSDPEGSQKSIYEAIVSAELQAKTVDNPRPLIFVAALNPHVGEGGKFGREDQDVVVPAVERARGEGINVVGPTAGDAVFIQALREKADAVVVLHRDIAELAAAAYAAVEETGQLRPFPVPAGVNITAGLKGRVIRVSVDHGTAKDRAWKPEVKDIFEESLLEVWELSAEMSRQKQSDPLRAAEQALRPWQAQLAFWVPALLVVVVALISSALGLPEGLWKIFLPWVFYGLGEVLTVALRVWVRDEKEGFRRIAKEIFFGTRAVATPDNYDPSNLVEVAHERIGHREKGIQSEFRIRLWGPLFLIIALHRQVLAVISRLLEWSPRALWVRGRDILRSELNGWRNQFRQAWWLAPALAGVVLLGLLGELSAAGVGAAMVIRASQTSDSLRWENPNRQEPLRGEEARLAELPDPSLVQELYDLTRPHLNRTRLLKAQKLSEKLRKHMGRENIKVLVKYEADQKTDSYKPRGVLADVIRQAERILAEKGSLKDIIWATESTGNHGKSLAWSVLVTLPIIFPQINETGGPGTVQIFIPSKPGVPMAKKQALKDIGADIQIIDGYYGAARRAVMQLKEGNPDVIHVEHDSPNVMAGHGGILFEIAEQLGSKGLLNSDGQLTLPVTVIVPAGSFGMAAGIALAARARFGDKVRVVAAQSINVRGGVESLRTGRIVPNPALGDRVILEDGTAVDQIGARAFALHRRIGDAAVAVHDVANGVRKLFGAIRELIGSRPFEGSVGNAVQVLFEYPDIVDSPDGNHKAEIVIVILSGGNTDDEQWAKAEWETASGDQEDPLDPYEREMIHERNLRAALLKRGLGDGTQPLVVYKGIKSLQQALANGGIPASLGGPFRIPCGRGLYATHMLSHALYFVGVGRDAEAREPDSQLLAIPLNVPFEEIPPLAIDAVLSETTKRLWQRGKTREDQEAYHAALDEVIKEWTHGAPAYRFRAPGTDGEEIVIRDPRIIQDGVAHVIGLREVLTPSEIEESERQGGLIVDPSSLTIPVDMKSFSGLYHPDAQWPAGPFGAMLIVALIVGFATVANTRLHAGDYAGTAADLENVKALVSFIAISPYTPLGRWLLSAPERFLSWLWSRRSDLGAAVKLVSTAA